MGILRIKGVDILQYVTPIEKTEIGTQHPAFPNKIRGLNTSIDNGSKKIVTGWKLPDANNYSSNPDYDAAEGKIKVNGVVQKVMYDGTRPRNVSYKAVREGVNQTNYINNVEGKLYLTTEPNVASGFLITTSRAKNKDCIINIVCWGAGGKGGGGAYWFLAGNWGGVGGGGGGKVMVTALIRNNEYIKFVTDSDSVKTGRITNSSDTTYQAPGLQAYVSSKLQSEWIECFGGYSGVSNNPRWYTDTLKGGGIAAVQSYGNLPFIKRLEASQTGKKKYNGWNGTDNTFKNSQSPYAGNPEGNYGRIYLTGYGGQGPDNKDTTSHGSGGAGGYRDGGKAGDTGTGSAGQAGKSGGGGGGSGSPAGGANGGDGGLPGFAIFY